MVDWLAGKRVRGTSSERTPLGVTLGGTGVGGWVELGRTTLDQGASTIDVASLPDKRYYMVLSDLSGSATRELLRFNNDIQSNYAYRYNSNGGPDGTAGGNSLIGAQGIYNTTNERFKVFYIANLSNKQKLVINHSVNMNGSGAIYAPNRYEVVGKWTNTLNAINEIDLVSWSGGNWASGGELVVLGWDPADTHTNNFWQELASVTQGSDADTFETGTFTAKKYLWVQAWIECSTTNIGIDPFVNSDIGSNYAYRYSNNGGSDVTEISERQFGFCGGFSATEKFFYNCFIINNSSNEKLGISSVITDTGSTGAGFAPSRREVVAKWANTLNPITKFGFKNRDAGSGQKIVTGSIIKVWGAD